jgi:plasmid stability protein
MSHRTSIYFDEVIHQALRMKAAVSGESVSDLVNEAVKQALAEDAEDFAALKTRASEPSMSFESVVADLQARGKL